jgi:HAD superfamily hydrolase (TIGR01509 family)
VPTNGSPHRCRRLPAVVLDVDGTLFDSEPFGHRIAFNQAFRQCGLDVQWDWETYRSLLGVTGGRRRIEAYLLRSGWPAAAASRAAGAVHERKTELLVDLALSGRIPTRPGVARLLRHLSDAGVALHIATTGRARWVRPLLDVTFGRDVFDVVVTGDDVLDLKPAPEVYQQVLRAAMSDTRHVVAIEDSRVGLTAARAAGLPCIVVRNAYFSAGPFPEAALVCSEFTQLTVSRVLGPLSCPASRRSRVDPANRWGNANRGQQPAR